MMVEAPSLGLAANNGQWPGTGEANEDKVKQEVWERGQWNCTISINARSLALRPFQGHRPGTGKPERISSNCHAIGTIFSKIGGPSSVFCILVIRDIDHGDQSGQAKGLGDRNPHLD